MWTAKKSTGRICGAGNRYNLAISIYMEVVMKIVVYVDARAKESDAIAEVEMLSSLIPSAAVSLVRGSAWADELQYANAVYRRNHVLVVLFY
jgi:hypothetical protein